MGLVYLGLVCSGLHMYYVSGLVFSERICLELVYLGLVYLGLVCAEVETRRRRG